MNTITAIKQHGAKQVIDCGIGDDGKRKIIFANPELECVENIAQVLKRRGWRFVCHTSDGHVVFNGGQ